MGPNPPAGAKACGNGTFDGAQALAECKLGAQYFAPPAANDACGQALMGSAEWKAFCTDDTAYIWTRFHDAEASGAASCKNWSLNPMYRASKPGGGTGGGSTGNNAKSGYWGTPLVGVSTTKTDVAIWITIDRKIGDKVSASLYLAGTPDVLGGCGGATPGTYLLLGAPISFTPQ